ncbi:MAG: protein kinase [Myxococcota bacterium]
MQRKLGQGPLAEVWRALKLDRQEPVALKILRPGALAPSAMRTSFERLVSSLSAAGRLDHPHLPLVLGTVRRPSDGLFGLSTPYFEGGPLFDAGDLTDPAALHDALELVIQLGQTVMWLHDQGFVHGGIKPSNILATPSPEGPSIQLLDLCWANAGLCRLEGTRFEPPELKRGPPTPATDQWAIARLVRILVARHAREPIGAWARVPKDLRTAVDRGLSEDPGARFERTAQLVDALMTAQAGLSSVAPTYPDPHQLPAPTIPLPSDRPPSLEINVEAPVEAPASSSPTAPHGTPTPLAPDSPAPRPNPVINLSLVNGPNPDAPTEPGMTEEEQANLRRVAGAARTVPMPRVERPERAASPSPREERAPVERPVEPADLTTPVAPEESRGLSLPFIVAAAAMATMAVYAWSAVQKPPSDIELATATPKAMAPAAEPPPLSLPPEAKTPAKTMAIRSPAPKAKPEERQKPAAPAPQTLPRKALPRKDASPDPATPAPKTVDMHAKDHAWEDCQSGMMRACVALAEQNERTKYWRAAAKARDQACRLGSRSSCLKAAEHFLAAGQGRLARRRFERLCDNRLAVACARLAGLFAKGVGGRQSARTADAFVDRACQLGHQPSCR